MCLLALAWKIDPRFPLILAANRDEFFGRPTAVAGWWRDQPEILGGRDLQAGGTWLGLHSSGRLAALTNFREPGFHLDDAPSRGELVQEFLMSGDVDAFSARLEREGQRYNGFNLLFGDMHERLCVYSNRADQVVRVIDPGFHGLSNHLWDTPWPKVVRVVDGMRKILGQIEEPSPEDLFGLLAERNVPPDVELPETGVGIEMERILGPLFIQTPLYGTRCSTVLFLEADGNLRFLERSFGPGPTVLGTQIHELRIP